MIKCIMTNRSLLVTQNSSQLYIKLRRSTEAYTGTQTSTKQEGTTKQYGSDTPYQIQPNPLRLSPSNQHNNRPVRILEPGVDRNNTKTCNTQITVNSLYFPANQTIAEATGYQTIKQSAQYS